LQTYFDGGTKGRYLGPEQGRGTAEGKGDRFLKMDVPILHLPRENTETGFFLFKGGRVDMWQSQLGERWEIPCGKNHSNLFTHLMAAAYFIFSSKGSGIGPR